jgi:hypothetical protein
MIRALVWLLKVSLFSIVILILGNWLKIGNRTISDQVKTELAQAERSEIASKLRSWASQVTTDSKMGSQIKARIEQYTGSSAGPNGGSPDHSSVERISQSERQKLKSLLQELNPPGGR